MSGRLNQDQARILISKRHAEWQEFNQHWRWLLDSLEGGQRYRDAAYGYDRFGMPIRNLVRHKREYPDPRELSLVGGSSFYPAGVAGGAGSAAGVGSGGLPGLDAAQYATDSDYEMRRARTPIPTFTREAVEKHLCKVYGKEVTREGPPDLEEWWGDVDGRGTPIGDWMEHVSSPLFMTLGQLDVLCDHPAAPEGADVANRADQISLGLHRAVVTQIIPENLLWWKIDNSGRYTEALVQEFDDSVTPEEAPGAYGASAPEKSRARYRYWTATESTLIDHDAKIISVTPHKYGRVPIVRVFDRRKARCKNIGQSRYEDIAEKQREYYNRDSELILSDTLQAHPLMQGPEDYVQADGTVPIGPSWLLPQKKNTQGASVTYQGFSVIDFPKDGAESIRKNKHDIRDEVDRSAKLTKPAGTAGTGKGTVSQSGVSKQLDNEDGHEHCGKVAKALARFERTLCELVLTVLRDRPVTQAEADEVVVSYPQSFDLQSAEEMASGLEAFQDRLGAAGDAPELETTWLQQLSRQHLKGQDDAAYEKFDKEIAGAVQAKAAQKAALPPPEKAPDVNPQGNAEGNASETPDTSPNYSPAPGYSPRGA